MSRSTQFIGLNDRSVQLIQGLVAKETHCTIGMFGEALPLYTYYKGNEAAYVEDEQATIWSSGPMIFTALRKVNNKNKTGGFGWVVKSLWTDKELAAFK